MNEPAKNLEESVQDDAAAMSAFVGRQPIFDQKLDVVGYELLFRPDTATNANTAGQGDALTTTVMNNSLSVIGLNTLTGGKKAFVNITRQLLIDSEYSVMPNDQTVLELLENVKADHEVVEACIALKKAGYELALDDIEGLEGMEPLLELADIVKVDFMASSPARRQDLAKSIKPYGAMLLAEKVESKQDQEEAVRLGYDLFQGYFFSKPDIISGKEIPGIHQNYLRLLAEVNRPDADFDHLDMVIKSDVSLSYKLLKYLNSVALGVRNEVASIKQAIVLLGHGPLKKWASLVTLSYLGKDKPDELMLTSLSRARFCETTALKLGMSNRQFDLFMLGLLSILDTLLHKPIGELVEPMPLSDDVKATLTGEETPLSKIYELALACERADVPLARQIATTLGYKVNAMEDAYRDSLFWADRISNS